MVGLKIKIPKVPTSISHNDGTSIMSFSKYSQLALTLVSLIYMVWLPSTHTSCDPVCKPYIRYWFSHPFQCWHCEWMIFVRYLFQDLQVVTYMLTGYLVPRTMSLLSVRLCSVGLVFQLSFVAYLAALLNVEIHHYTFVVSLLTLSY